MVFIHVDFPNSYSVDTGSISSLHDRACEVFCQPIGGTVVFVVFSYGRIFFCNLGLCKRSFDSKWAFSILSYVQAEATV